MRLKGHFKSNEDDTILPVIVHLDTYYEVIGITELVNGGWVADEVHKGYWRIGKVNGVLSLRTYLEYGKVVIPLKSQATLNKVKNILKTSGVKSRHSIRAGYHND